MNTSLKNAPSGVSKAEPNTQSALLPTYARAELAFERGNGAWLTSTEGRRYLDFAAVLRSMSRVMRIRIS